MTDKINEYEGRLHRWVDNIFDKITNIATKAINSSMAGDEAEYNRLAQQSRDFEKKLWDKYPNAMRAAAKRQGTPIPPGYEKKKKDK